MALEMELEAPAAFGEHALDVVMAAGWDDCLLGAALPRPRNGGAEHAARVATHGSNAAQPGAQGEQPRVLIAPLPRLPSSISVYLPPSLP